MIHSALDCPNGVVVPVWFKLVAELIGELLVLTFFSIGVIFWAFIIPDLHLKQVLLSML